MSSDNVNLISWTTNVLAGATATTEKVLLGQYISLSIIGSASEDLSVVIQFSGDGVNWDYSVTRALPVGSNTQLSSPVLAKWTRLQITNNGLVATTHLRVFVYGTPSNSSISAQISKIGNLNPVVDIGNLPLAAFGEVMAVESEPWTQYTFNHGTTGNMATGTWASPYSDLYAWSTAFGATGANIRFTDGVVRFGNNCFAGDRAIFYGSPVRYRPGQGFQARFTAYFNQGVKNAGSPPTMEYVGIGNADANDRPDNGYFFGYGDPLAVWVDPATNFGIVYVDRGVRVFYPRSSWNVDKCDGTNVMPALDFSKSQVYFINFQYLGFGAVRFYVENPDTGLPQLVHVINRVNAVQKGTNLGDPSLSFMMFVEGEGAMSPITLLDEIGSGSSVIMLEGIALNPYERIGVEGSKTALSAEAVILSVRADTVFYGAINRYSLEVDFVSAACDGTKPCIIRIYRNCTLAGAAWASPAPNTLPMSFDVTGTVGAYGPKLFSFGLGKADNAQLDLASLHTLINPGDQLTFTATSAANTDAVVTVSLHIR